VLFSDIVVFAPELVGNNLRGKRMGKITVARLQLQIKLTLRKQPGVTEGKHLSNRFFY